MRISTEEGKILWKAYFDHTDVRSVRDKLKLNLPDFGWYQVRKDLQARNSSGDFPPVNFRHFALAYQTLNEKLQPMVYELGFLKAWRLILDVVLTKRRTDFIGEDTKPFDIAKFFKSNKFRLKPIH
ncbi:hypothetical protein [Chryseobacterium sp. MP_3.2]|uniref:hypothetical protein n=1 Tax=Chryseobacterium sp. MP_3.2 TaxID=3071712 RepID=UPI002E08EA7C|nr:hypothetical protein [Chryseobacterium sp. MP_3.2]